MAQKKLGPKFGRYRILGYPNLGEPNVLRLYISLILEIYNWIKNYEENTKYNYSA